MDRAEKRDLSIYVPPHKDTFEQRGVKRTVAHTHKQTFDHIKPWRATPWPMTTCGNWSKKCGHWKNSGIDGKEIFLFQSKSIAQFVCFDDA
jgi:hypothetical protein